MTIELDTDASSLRAGGESAADVFQELGAWEGESLEELLAFFAEARRQGGSRGVPELTVPAGPVTSSR